MKINHFTVRPKNIPVDFSKATNLKKGEEAQPKNKGSLTNLVKNNMKTPRDSQDRIKSLQDRRQELVARRSEYLASAKEQNLDKDVINGKLADYDSQISQLDQQIAQIRKEERDKQMKGSEGSAKDSAQNINGSSGQIPEQGNAEVEATQKLLSAFGSIQHTKDYIAAMQDVKGRLETEASYYAPSRFYHGNPQKYASLKAKAGSVESEIVRLEKDLRKAGDSIMDGVQGITEKAAEDNSVGNKAEEENPYGLNKTKKAMDVYA